MHIKRLRVRWVGRADCRVESGTRSHSEYFRFTQLASRRIASPVSCGVRLDLGLDKRLVGRIKRHCSVRPHLYYLAAYLSRRLRVPLAGLRF